MRDYTQRDSNKHYSYDPTEITDNGVNQMRFELGDTDVSDVILDEVHCHGLSHSLICDEEYEAIIGSSSSWKNAKIKLLKHMVMQMAYDVDKFTIDGLSIDWSGRYNRFKKMLDDMEASDNLPSVDKTVIGPNGRGKHYFYDGMLRNPRKF